MLQEKATKQMADLLYKNLTSHFFREFTSKLQLEINKEPVTGGMLIPEQRFGQPTGKSRFSSQPPPQQQQQQQAADRSMSNQYNASPPHIPIQNNSRATPMDRTNNQREQPPPVHHQLSLEQSIDLMGDRDDTFERMQQVQALPQKLNSGLQQRMDGSGIQGNNSNTFDRLAKKQPMPSQSHHQPLLTPGAPQNLVVNSLLQLIEDKINNMPTTTAYAPTHIAPVNALASKLKRLQTTRVSQQQQQQQYKSAKQSDQLQQTEIGSGGSNDGFLRVGDIILLYYDENVYDELIGAGGGSGHQDPNVSNDMAREKAAQSDNLKARITQRPDLEYKGIIYSDGVTDKSFKVKPRHLTNQTSAFSQFKKTLFRVEIAQECKYNIIKQDLLDKLDTLERERLSYNEEKINGGKGGAVMRRNNKEKDELDALIKRIDNVETLLHENEKRLSEETKNNAYEFQINLGKKITYGQKIQLKHLFSDQYLTLNMKKISHEYGCVTLNLSPPNANSWFNIVPAENIKSIGQSISYLDAFHIQNFSASAFETPIFYVHVNSYDLGKLGSEAQLEVNGSFQTSKFRAKLFMDYTHMQVEKSSFESGDVIRMHHKEAEGFLTVFERDVELSLPQLPDFLQRQVNKIEGMGGVGEQRMTMGGGGDGDGVDYQEQARARLVMQNEIRRRNQIRVYIERDEARLQFTNSCWEIQKVKAYHGGPIFYDDCCRLRHIGTGKYLAVSATDKRELLLKENTDTSDTLFRLRKDTYRPLNEKKARLLEDSLEAVSPHDLIILETYHHSYVHLSETIKEEFSLQRGDTNSGNAITTNVKKGTAASHGKANGEDKGGKHGGKEGEKEEAKGGVKAKQLEIHEDSNRIEPVCGYFSRDDSSKMIFTLDEVSHDDNDTQIAYKASSFYKSLLQYYSYLNSWAVIDVDEEELEILGFQGIAAELIDKQKYDFEVARLTEQELMEETDLFEQNVIDQLSNMVMHAKDSGFDNYMAMQKHLAEQGILVMLLKILELTYYKCVAPAQREKDLLGIESQIPMPDPDESPEVIASELLENLAIKILKLIYFLIKQNTVNAEKMTKYDNIIYMMSTRYDAKLVSKIFKETYKRAQNIEGDQDEFGDSQNLANAVGTQLAGSLFGTSMMKKWTDRLDTISYISDGNENISKQILQLQVISMMCRNNEGKGIFHYQNQAIRHILDITAKIPITFAIQRKEIDRPIVFINKRANEDDEKFLQKNPLLRDIYKQHRAINDGSDTLSQGRICLDLYDLSKKNQEKNYTLQPYIDFIAAVINMYCHMSLSRNQIAVKKLKAIGLTFDHVIGAITQYSSRKAGARNNRKGDSVDILDKKLIAAYIFAARVMFIDTNLFPSLLTYKNRCYYWETIHQADAHKTMYKWEKNKFFRGFEENNRFLKEEQDQHEQLAMGQLRDCVYNFFSEMPEVLRTFLYSYETRPYTKKDVTPVLTLIFNFIDAATSLIQCELVDSKFIYRMLQAASYIFVSYHHPDMPKTNEEKSFLYAVLFVAKKVKRCKEKIEILEYKTLKMLETICKFRMNSQILIFLQLFRIFVEKNQLPHVSQATSAFDEQFQVIFQLYQFNIGKNLTFKTIERMAQIMALTTGGSKSTVTTLGPRMPKLSSVATGVKRAPMYLAAGTEQDMEDPGNQLLQIAEIKLTEDQKAGGEGGGPDEVDDEGNAIAKASNPVHNDMDDEDDEGEDYDDGDENGRIMTKEHRGERARRRRQLNDRFELDKFILYLIFAKSTNQGIRNLAVRVLVQNFNQRELLMNELTKIELIISTQDQADYTLFMQEHFRMRGLIDQLSNLNMEMRAAGGNGRNRDIQSYRKTIDDIGYILKSLTANLAMHVNTIVISVGEDLLIQQESIRLMKKQNMLKHMDIADDLIDKLMKTVVQSGSFRKDWHSEMFREASRFLFMYSFANPSNQWTMVSHLTFLVSLTDLDVPTPKLISQVLSEQRESEHGLKFLQFLTEKIANQSSEVFRSSLFKLLTLMMTKTVVSQSPGSSGSIQIVNIEANQVFVLKRLVKKHKFRKSLFMDERTSRSKLEIVQDLCQRIADLRTLGEKLQKDDKVNFIAQEQEAMNLHLAIIDLLSACVRGCLFGRLQARGLVTVEVLFDSILSESIPYLVRRKYLRLLFEVYLRHHDDDTVNLDFNTERFYQMMFYIIYEDLRQYPQYYSGLLQKPKPEAPRDNETEALRRRVDEALQQRSVEDVRKRNMERTRQEQENFKQVRQGLSTLVPPVKALVLFDAKDLSEYWKYLSQYKKSRNEADGLLHFISDFYTNAKLHNKKMENRELIEVTVKIREILMEMSDDLTKINEQYGEHLKNVDHMLNVLDQAVASIPNVRTFKAGKKFNVRGGAPGQKEAEVQVIDENDNGIDDRDEIGSQENEEDAEERKRAMADANDSRNLDIKMASDKIINILRDTVINEGTNVRPLFLIKNFEQNFIMRKIDLKKLIKFIVGTQATNDEVEMFMQYIDKFSREETEQRKTIQPDIANEGHIKTRVDPLRVLQLNEGHATLTNFRDLENILRKALQKLQYKPPVKKRARDEMDEELNLQMAEDELSNACNTDLKLFTKCFFDFFKRFKSKDEIADIVSKITIMFNDAFDKDESGVRKEDLLVIRTFIQNMIQGFSNGKDKIYLLRVLNMVIENYLPKNNRMIVKTRLRLAKLQVIMKDCGLLNLLLHFISQDDLKISDEAIKLLCNLLCESNSEVQDYLLDLMKKNRDNFKFFFFLKDRLAKSSDFLIQEMKTKEQEQKAAIDATKCYKDPRIDAMKNLYQQPFYLPSQAQSGQTIFNLESEIKILNQQQSSGELLNILRLVQLLCDNCHQGFQDYLRNQEENSIDQQPLTTVNVVSEVAMVLIKLTENVGLRIFTEYILYETVVQLFDTLIDFLHGPNAENQKLLGQWKKLSKAVNFYLQQNLGVYASNTTEQKAKLTIMKSCSDFLNALTECVNLDFKLAIIKEMVPEINLGNLKKKMVEIFHYKIGADPKKQRTYYSNKKCYHYRENTPIKRSNMCEKDEFCEFGHLIKFDKQIIAAGFNIFIFLFNFKEVDPGNEDLQDFDSDFKNEKYYQKLKANYQKEVSEHTLVTPERFASVIEQNEIEIREAIERRTEEILIQVTIKNPTTKIYPELAKREQNALLEGGGENNNLDESGAMEKDVFEMDQDDNKARGKKKKAQRKQQPAQRWYKKIFPCCRRGGNKKTNKISIQNQNAMNGEHNLLLESFDLQEIGQAGPVQAQRNRSKKTSKSLEQIIKDDLEAEALEKYTLWQYMMDCAIRFYVSNVANIEINYKENLSKVMFRIPPFCTFFTRTSQRKMIYEANHESHIEKLEDFFNKKKIYRAEMKAIQRLARRSKILRWISQQWKSLSNIALFLVLIINLLFIIFYKLDVEGHVSLGYKEAEISVELLGILQAFISFLVMTAYIMRYHGRIWEDYMEQYKLDNRGGFTTVKGSLGYAFGSEVYKLSHQSKVEAAQQNMGGVSINSGATLTKQKEDEYILERNRRKINKDEVSYGFKIFLIAMKLDTQHAFNVVYFLLSIMGVFYHTIFSFLLLDIIIKIPLLQNVVQAIVQNRKQLLYTFLLLFVIIYIYSFVAFRILRESYINSDNSDEAPDMNTYCSTLLECFTSTMNNGIRSGGGIGDILEQLSMYKDENAYWIRYVFDISFFFLVIIILLNLIFGIIIDAFADMRDSRNAIESDVKERCFICGLGRFEFETKNKSWFDHIQKEHNAYAYLYFILYVQQKPGNQCSGVEKYVKQMVLKEDPTFFPVGRCLSIGGASEPAPGDRRD